MHANINKYILAHTFLSSYPKLPASLGWLTGEKNKQKKKTF